MLDASTTCSANWFQRSMTLLEKKNFNTSLLSLILINFTLWPRVPLHLLSKIKKSLILHFEYPLIILNTSIRSDLYLLSSGGYILRNAEFRERIICGNLDAECSANYTLLSPKFSRGSHNRKKSTNFEFKQLTVSVTAINRLKITISNK